MIVSVLVDGSSSDSASRSQEDCDGAGTVAHGRRAVKADVNVSIGGRSSGGGEWARGRGAYLEDDLQHAEKGREGKGRKEGEKGVST